MRDAFGTTYGGKAGRMFLFGAVVIALAAALAVVFMTRNSPDGPTASADSLSAPLSAPAEAGFIRIEDIMGEAEEQAHRDWIELESFSHSISNPQSFTGGAGGAGQSTVRDFVITKKVDKASPLLMEAALSGQQFATVQFDVTRPGKGGAPIVYLKYTFEDVLITNYRVGGASSGEVPPAESISFGFRTVTVTYTPESEDGTPGKPVEIGWDVGENTKL